MAVGVTPSIGTACERTELDALMVHKSVDLVLIVPYPDMGLGKSTMQPSNPECELWTMVGESQGDVE
jgi:hypothetical protein